MSRLRGAERAFTVIELAVGLWILGIVATVAYAWVAVSSRTAQGTFRSALYCADEERLAGMLAEDLAGASRLAPDAGGNGFTLDLPRESGEPDHVRYWREAAKDGGALMRAFTPAKAATGPPLGAVTARVASSVAACIGEEPDARSFRVRVRWEKEVGPDFLVDVARRLSKRD